MTLAAIISLFTEEPWRIAAGILATVAVLGAAAAVAAYAEYKRST